jgi:hypothetical protein
MTPTGRVAFQWRDTEAGITRHLGSYDDRVMFPQMPRKPSHTDDWVEACKTNDPSRPGTNFSYAGPLTETVLLGIAAYRAGEKLSWDAKNLKITNNPKAECFIRRDIYRKGWTL